MKALFGVVSLLVVLAIVGMLASRQMKAVSPMAAASSPTSAAVPVTVREQSIQTQEKVRDDIARALEQGARRDESDK